MKKYNRYWKNAAQLVGINAQSTDEVPKTEYIFMQISFIERVQASIRVIDREPVVKEATSYSSASGKRSKKSCKHPNIDTLVINIRSTIINFQW